MRRIKPISFTQDVALRPNYYARQIAESDHINRKFIFKYIMNLISVYFTLVVLSFLAQCFPKFKPTMCTQLSFLPMPKKIECNLAAEQPYKLQNPCNILYNIKGSTQEKEYKHFIELIEHQQYKTFRCHLAHITIGKMAEYKTLGFAYNVNIQVTDHSLKSAFTTKEEAYSIKIEVDKAQLKSATYVGFVRALETLMQSITCDKYKVANCQMNNLPITIEDQPAFVHRAVMVDTSRHYQPIRLLYETVDALMYNKMNVMHWHIVDEDSFPLKLDSHPQIAEYGAFSSEEIYTTQEVRDLVRYALVRGVRIIPELDTPGHAASWGRAPQNSKVACTFGNTGYMGPLDVTLDETYKLVKEVFTEIFDLFPDPVVHLGGDEVVLTCLTNKTEFILKQGIKQQQIELHYRRKQRKMLKQVNPNKRFMYWMNSRIQLEEGDIVHWWGGGLPQTKLQVVISQYGPFYIDMGVGNYFGVNYGSYVTWLDLHNQNIGRMVSSYSNKENVLGAEVTLWSEISNQYTHHLKIWIRSSSLAERTWTTENFNPKPDFFRRITAHQRLMNRRGIPTAPATCQQCEFNPQFC